MSRTRHAHTKANNPCQRYLTQAAKRSQSRNIQSPTGTLESVTPSLYPSMITHPQTITLRPSTTSNLRPGPLQAITNARAKRLKGRHQHRAKIHNCNTNYDPSRNIASNPEQHSILGFGNEYDHVQHQTSRNTQQKPCPMITIHSSAANGGTSDAKRNQDSILLSSNMSTNAGDVFSHLTPKWRPLSTY